MWQCIDALKTGGLTTLTNAVLGQRQNCSENLEISPGIGTRDNSGTLQKKLGHQRNVSQKFGRMIQIPGTT